MDLTLEIKIASLIVHADEYMNSKQPHPFDREVFNSLLANKDVDAWLKKLDSKALLPKKRQGGE